MSHEVNEDNAKERPNILLVTIDSLRTDHLTTYGYQRETSPNIDRLATKGRKYRMAFSHGGGTAEAFPPMLSGASPPANVEQADMGLKRGMSVTALLKASGYSTGAFNSNPFLSAYFGYSDSFDFFYHNLGPSVKRTHTVSTIGDYFQLMMTRPPIIRGKDLTTAAISWIETCSTPFFAWIHYMDVHVPYLPPGQFVKDLGVRPSNRFHMLWLYRKVRKSDARVYKLMDPKASLMDSREISKITDYYDGAIRYVDSCVGELIRALERQSKLQNTLVIVTSDHGDSLCDHGAIDHALLYDEVIHIPLMILGPNVKAGVDDSHVTHTLIYEAIKDIASADEPSGKLPAGAFADFGKGIISTVVDVDRKTYSVRTKDWHYIETIDLSEGRTKMELFNLRNDPKETKNLLNELADLASIFHQRITDYLQIGSTSGKEVGRKLLSEDDERELHKKLRMLGYE